MGDNSDDSDEWGMEELDIPANIKNKATSLSDGDTCNAALKEGDEEFWANKPEPKKEDAEPEENTKPEKKKAPIDDRPLIIVDMTNWNPDINNKFDKNGCSDPAAASALRKQIEQGYEKYASDSELLQNGTVIPCGMSVWRDALARLRDERPGHYFAPIFPAKKA